MPTPVATAKQCLTPEAAHALDEAVSVARGRSHAQTTSLHAVSAFLSLPSSPLRDACFRTRNAAFRYYSSPRAQIRALDFALSVSLDRSPASPHKVTEPPISNSLMAAVKRSQANQRRQPDGFGKEQLGTSGIRVEIQNLIVAILDDPIVSRVFNEAGFSSFDLKLAMVRPLQGFWRYSNPRVRPFKFPFSGEFCCGDEDFRRVGEVLVRKQGRNPLLFGVCAYDALQGFVEGVRTQDQFMPLEIRGVTAVSVEREILNLSSGEEMMKARFEELDAMVEGCCGPGLIISFGDLKAFVKDDHDFSCLIDRFTKLLELHKERVWLIGCATYEIYLRFLSKFSCVEKDWDLQPLAITSMKFSKGDVGFKSSLMGSFVPFAGFFSPSSDFGGMARSPYQLPIRNSLCNKKSAQEAMPGSGYDSVADRCHSTLPSWLRMDKISTSNGSDTLKAKSDVNESQVSLTSGISVATDLVLGVSNHSRPEFTGHLDNNDFKSLSEALIQKIQGQEEAVRVISQTISQTRDSNGKVKGSRIRGDIWMNFIGSDTFGMKKTAIALAEVVCGNKGSLIHVDLSSPAGLVDQCTVFGSQLRRTTIDQIAGELSKIPSSVVFLENLHLARPPAQNSLLHAIKTGKFLDSSGREVAISNAIFLLSSEAGSGGSSCTHNKLKPWPMQIIVNAPSSLLNKRKLDSTDELMKRSYKGSVTRLDLNLPADENTNESLSYALLEEISSHMDAKVVFETFNYDAFVKKVIQDCFLKSFCSGCVLEIDPRVVNQLSERKSEVGDWMKNVLSEWFVEARKRYHNIARHCLVKLACVRPLYREEEEEVCEWLPSKVIFHCRPLESL